MFCAIYIIRAKRYHYYIRLYYFCSLNKVIRLSLQLYIMHRDRLVNDVGHQVHPCKNQTFFKVLHEELFSES